MSKPLEELVKQVLAKHGRGDKIREAFDHANGAIKSIHGSATWRRRSTRRAIFWELAVDKLIESTACDPGLHVVEHYDTVSFIFDDAVLVRLKKADMSLYSSNYPTSTAELFHIHQYDLFGYNGLQRVEAIYIPNQFDTDILWSGVVARQQEDVLWHYELVAPVVVSVVPLEHPAQPTADDLAKLKNQIKDDEKKSDRDGNR